MNARLLSLWILPILQPLVRLSFHHQKSEIGTNNALRSRRESRDDWQMQRKESFTLQLFRVITTLRTARMVFGRRHLF